MFDFVREKKRFVQILLGGIILSFAFWGAESYQQAGNVAHPASVNDSNITQYEFDEALRMQKNNLRERFGGQVDVSMLDTPEMQRAVLDGLIAERVLQEHAREVGLTVTDQQIANVVQHVEAFQQDGRFDLALYESMLASRNMSALGFEYKLRQDLLAEQLRGAYLQNGFYSNAVLDKVIALNERQWVVRESAIDFNAYLGQVTIDDAQIAAYYQENQSEFNVPEQVKVAYVEFSKKQLAESLDVTEQDARAYYQSHQGDYGLPEQRQASHILITVDSAAPDAEQQQAKEKAEKVLALVKANPEQFAELAKEHSEDIGSAVNGGDLGLFGPKMMVKPFEEAAFALEKDQISDLVKSEFGYHIIKVTDIQAATISAFEEVRADVEAQLRDQQAIDIFAERAEEFSNLVYEQSDSLDAAADVAEVEVQQSDWLIKGRPSSGLWTAELLEAVFSDEVKLDKMNTPALEVLPDTLVAARVIEHKPASVTGLEGVKDRIASMLEREQAMQLAVAAGEQRLEKLKAGEAVELDWGEEIVLSRAQRGDLHPDLSKLVYTVNQQAELPYYVGQQVMGRGFVLVRVDKLEEGDKPDKDKRERYAEQLRKLVGEEMLLAFLQDTKSQMEITVRMKTDDTE